VHYRVNNGGHTWPSLNATFPGTSRDFEASQVIWDFFKKHQLNISSSYQQYADTGYQIYPNPFSDYIFLDTDYGTEISIYDSQGRLTLKTSYLPGKHTIQTAGWRSGFYIAYIKDKNNHKHIKLIKP
jgi:polyhydroxybutyrate depolymerase